MLASIFEPIFPHSNASLCGFLQDLNPKQAYHAVDTTASCNVQTQQMGAHITGALAHHSLPCCRQVVRALPCMARAESQALPCL